MSMGERFPRLEEFVMSGIVPSAAVIALAVGVGPEGNHSPEIEAVAPVEFTEVEDSVEDTTPSSTEMPETATAAIPETTTTTTQPRRTTTTTTQPTTTTTSTTTTSTQPRRTTTTVEQLSPQEQLVEDYNEIGEIFERADPQPGQRIGYMAINGEWLTDLYMSVDLFSSSPLFVDYVDHGAGVAADYVPGLVANATVGGHRTSKTHPFSTITDYKQGEELDIFYELDTDKDGALDTRARLTYRGMLDSYVRINPDEVQYSTNQEYDTPILTRFTCDRGPLGGTQFRIITQHELESVATELIAENITE